MAAEGVFRKDLFYRLNVIPITLLPLRDRQEDILLLTFYFVRVFNEIYCGEKQVSEKLMRAFLDYMWPGNVRELRNTVERLVLLSDALLVDDHFAYFVDISRAHGDDQIPFGRVCAHVVGDVLKGIHVVHLLLRMHSFDLFGQLL